MKTLEETIPTVYHQLMYLISNCGKFKIKESYEPGRLKYLESFTVQGEDAEITFYRNENPDALQLSFNYDFCFGDTDNLKMTNTTSLEVGGELRKCLAEAIFYIRTSLEYPDHPSVTNNPVALLRKLQLANHGYLDRRLINVNPEDWMVNHELILKLNKLFSAVTQVQREEPGMAWLISNHALTINNRSTDQVFIEIHNRTQCEVVSFNPIELENEFDFYIQLHKCIKTVYATNPLFRCTMDAFSEWEESMYTAIKLVTGKSAYIAVNQARDRLPTPPDNVECIYANQILTIGEEQ